MVNSKTIKSVTLAALMLTSVLAMTGGVAGQTTPTLSVSDDTVDAGTDASVDLTVDTVPDGLQTYNVTLELSDGSAADIDTASGNAISGNSFQIVDSSADSITIRGADLGGAVNAGDTDVNLATIDLTNTAQGART